MQSSRAELIAETAITLLAERGMRGLTHRAVDEAAGLPPGSTSNLARTRAALLELALIRLTELGEQDYNVTNIGEAAGVDVAKALGITVIDLIAQVLYEKIYGDGRRITIALYELALEATRRPELRGLYDKAHARFGQATTALMDQIGSSEPARHGRQLTAFTTGLTFYAIADAAHEPTLDELRRAIADFLRWAAPGR
jgi:DNA-binding transcriptional regulator YbjK